MPIRLPYLQSNALTLAQGQDTIDNYRELPEIYLRISYEQAFQDPNGVLPSQIIDVILDELQSDKLLADQEPKHDGTTFGTLVLRVWCIIRLLVDARDIFFQSNVPEVEAEDLHRALALASLKLLCSRHLVPLIQPINA
ncbi:hypothetical protein MGYG_04262 [Nannizzia gypsea CBS 118893]|uniref:Uncharacterized protein n=1 Tax=Arthroderma gypseum (strain ATCC MYA-4604 / CBS 118893) TaxID=535722 RepID=E4US00_ARTGP|nr:hypothetical protein MGYG_04262 [Nannizzia gypsea CBS 118893]EFR01257.1 hypothetical protein MGYG_04262 [Nannizzia gypsea CBS 118893]